MNRTIITTSLIACTLASAQEQPDYEAPPAPDAWGVQDARMHSVDAHAFYAMNAGEKDHYSPMNMWGVDIAYSRFVTDRQAFTLTSGLSIGASKESFWMDAQGNRRVDVEFARVDIPLMVGYRVTQPLGRNFSVTLGVQGGLDLQIGNVNDNHEEKWDEDEEEYRDEYDKSNAALGTTWAAYGQLEWRLVENLHLVTGYRYRGATTRPDACSKEYGFRVKSKAMQWHEIHIGLKAVF